MESKRAKIVPATGKDIAFLLWDSRSTIFINILSKLKNITGQYFAFLLDPLQKESPKITSHLAKKKVSFFQEKISNLHGCLSQAS